MKRHTAADKILMAQVASAFRGVMQEKNWDARTAAEDLGVSLASFYNYLAKTDVPRLEVLKRAHERWGVSFSYIDFSTVFAGDKKKRKVDAVQTVFDFLEGVREQDITVEKVKPQGTSMELRLRIKFTG